MSTIFNFWYLCTWSIAHSLERYEGHCSVLQCVAVCCRAMSAKEPYVSLCCCSVLWYVAALLQCVAVHSLERYKGHASKKITRLLSHLWSDIYVRCLTWLIHMCDVTHWYLCVTWLIHCVWRDSFTCMTWLFCPPRRRGTWHIRMRDMTHPYVCHDSFICVPWIFHTHDISHLIYAIWLLPVCNITQNNPCPASYWSRPIIHWSCAGHWHRRGLTYIYISNIHINIHMQISIYKYIYIHVCIYIYVYMNVQIEIQIYMYIYLFLHTYIYLYINIQIYTYI